MSKTDTHLPTPHMFTTTFEEMIESLTSVIVDIGADDPEGTTLDVLLKMLKDVVTRNSDGIREAFFSGFTFALVPLCPESVTEIRIIEDCFHSAPFMVVCDDEIQF